MDKTHKIKLIIILIIGIAIGGFAFSNTSSEAQKTVETPPYSPSFEQQLFDKTNALRASKGLPALQPNSTLKNKSRSWAMQMFRDNKSSHSDVSTNNGDEKWIIAGENVGLAKSSQEAFNLLVASPTHYDNLVDPRFTHMSVGAVEIYGNISNVYFFAQEFMQITPEPTTTIPTATTTTKKSGTVCK